MTSFEHDEYHIYTTDSDLQKRHVHLTSAMVNEAQDLHESTTSDASHWTTIYRRSVADRVYLEVGDGKFAPRLTSKGYEGWETCRHGDFEEPVYFDDMIFHKCIGTLRPEPEWSFSDVKEWIDPVHREQFEREFDEYLAEVDDDDATVDW